MPEEKVLGEAVTQMVLGEAVTQMIRKKYYKVKGNNPLC